MLHAGSSTGVFRNSIIAASLLWFGPMIPRNQMNYSIKRR